MATAPFGIWGQVAARLQHWANGVKEPWFQGGRDCTYPSVASNPPGAGWLVPAALPSVLPASGAHPGPAQVCSDSGSCCGAWCLCGPAPCLAPAPGPAPDLDPPGPAPAPAPSPAPGPALGCALAASLAPAAGSVPARPPSPSPSAPPLLAPFAASPAPWPVQPALPPSEQSVAGRKAENRHLNPFTPVPPGPPAPGRCTPSSGSPSALLLHRKGEGPAVTPVLVSEPQAFPLFTCYSHDR